MTDEENGSASDYRSDAGSSDIERLLVPKVIQLGFRHKRKRIVDDGGRVERFDVRGPVERRQ
jgi:hypothetical protein